MIAAAPPIDACIEEARSFIAPAAPVTAVDAPLPAPVEDAPRPVDAPLPLVVLRSLVVPAYVLPVAPGVVEFCRRVVEEVLEPIAEPLLPWRLVKAVASCGAPLASSTTSWTSPSFSPWLS